MNERKGLVSRFFLRSPLPRLAFSAAVSGVLRCRVWHSPLERLAFSPGASRVLRCRVWRSPLARLALFSAASGVLRWLAFSAGASGLLRWRVLIDGARNTGEHLSGYTLTERRSREHPCGRGNSAISDA